MQANLKGIQNNIERVFANYSENLAPKKTLPKLEIVNNEDWYRDMNVMTFMGKVGRRLRISRMLGRYGGTTYFLLKLHRNSAQQAFSEVSSGEYRRPLLHRVHVPGLTSARLGPPARHQALPGPAWWQRPAGEHGGGAGSSAGGAVLGSSPSTYN